MKRATGKMLDNYVTVEDFNPRPREEGDERVKALLFRAEISIHALVKRATKRLRKRGCNISISIHALVKRATEAGYVELYFPLISIHALVKRATRLYGLGVPCRPYFNPRPREEGDQSSPIGR